jgi:UDP-N-acetyl-D-glucosamine dehydrogenase
MPYAVVDRLAEAVDRLSRRAFSGASILVIGLAYKKNVDDIRESPSLKLIELIERRGGFASYHDPFVAEIPPTREHPALAGRKSVALGPQTLAEFDAVLIATDHDVVDYRLLVENSKVIVDTRNACQRAGLSDPRIVKA